MPIGLFKLPPQLYNWPPGLFRNPSTGLPFNPAFDTQFANPAVAKELADYTQSFWQGAVVFGDSSDIIGSSALSQNFQQGVLSFWMNYDSSVSQIGDGARIIQGPIVHANNNSMSNCTSNNGLSNVIPLYTQGSIYVRAGVFSLDLYLVDTTNNAPLLGVQVPYVSGNNTGGGPQWVSLGSWASLINVTPFTWNGTFYGPDTIADGEFVLVQPCGGQVFNTITTGHVSNRGGPVGGACVNSTEDLPASTGSGAVRFVFQGIDGQLYPTAEFPAQVYLDTTYSTGGTPTPGWHHYIFSFDASQIITDTNGANCIRCQCAIDRGGGPIERGGIYDTMAVLPGPNTQPFLSTFEAYGNTGVMHVSQFDLWQISAPKDAGVNYAYCYFGIPNNGFFDLTNPANLNQFVSPDLAPVNWAAGGRAIPAITPVFIHTGNADSIFDFTPPAWNATTEYPIWSIVSYHGANWQYNPTLITLVDPNGLPVPNLNFPPGGQVPVWQQLNGLPTTGVEFTLNAAAPPDATLNPPSTWNWSVSGSIANALTEPPIPV